MGVITALLLASHVLAQDSLADKIKNLPNFLVVSDEQKGEINVQSIDGQYKRLILKNYSLAVGKRSKYILSAPSLDPGGEVVVRAIDTTDHFGGIWFGSATPPARKVKEPTVPDDVSRFHHAVYFADDPDADPAWLDHTEMTTEEQAFTLHIADKQYVLSMDGNNFGVVALFKPDIALIKHRGTTSFYQFSTGKKVVVTDSGKVCLVPIRSKSDIEQFGKQPYAISTVAVPNTMGMRIQYRWNLEHPSDLEPRNPTLENGYRGFAPFVGRPIDEVYYEMPGWLRRVLPVKPPERPAFKSREDALKRTEVDLIVFDKDGMKSVELFGLKSRLIAKVSDVSNTIGSIFTLGVSSSAEAIAIRTKGKIKVITEYVPRDWGNHTFVYFSELIWGKKGITADTGENSKWRLVKDSERVNLSNGERSFAVDVPIAVRLSATFSTGFALLSDQSTLYLVDLVEGTLLGSIPALEFAVWPSSPHIERY